MSSNVVFTRHRAAWSIALVATVVVGMTLTSSGRGLLHRFRASLRIAKPEPVKLNSPAAFAGPTANRRVLEAIGGMLATKVDVTLDEADQPVANADAASALAGFPAQLPRARSDHATLIVAGAHAIRFTIDRATLRTILTQAGRPAAALPDALEGAPVTVTTPRGVRAQYGNCPAPPSNTLQGQLQDAPSPTADNANCIVLSESPVADARFPDGLDVAQLVEIALELSGMSPNQTQAFQSTFDWHATMVLSMPRSMRSFEAVTVDGARGILVTAAGRRGPTSVVLWMKHGLLFTLAGYGNPADAVSLANSVQ
jgi:hypothetical protein